MYNVNIYSKKRIKGKDDDKSFEVSKLNKSAPNENNMSIIVVIILIFFL